LNFNPGEKLDYGQEEAAAKFGDDPRVYSITTKRFVGDANGHVKEAHTVECRWEKGPDGRPKLVDAAATEKVWPAQLVLSGHGISGPRGTARQAAGVATDERSNAKAEYGRFATSAKGVFAAGDARRGQSLVVRAIAEGRQCAREVDRFLMGETSLP